MVASNPILILLICAFQELVDLTIAEVTLIFTMFIILVGFIERLANLFDPVKWLNYFLLLLGLSFELSVLIVCQILVIILTIWLLHGLNRDATLAIISSLQHSLLLLSDL